MSSLYLQENLRILKSKYPNQAEYLWKKIETCFHYSILKGGEPSIIILVSDNTTLEKSEELPFDVLKAIYAASNEKFIKQSTPTSDAVINSLLFFPNKMEKDNNTLKMEMNTKLKSIFSQPQKGKVALVNKIENIPVEAMLLFHTYGDIGPAVEYPGIVILMTLHLDFQIEQEKRDLFLKSSKEFGKYTEEYLFNLWSKDEAKSQIDALFVRIANNILYLN